MAWLTGGGADCPLRGDAMRKQRKRPHYEMSQRLIGAQKRKSAPPVSRQAEPMRIHWTFSASAATPAVTAIIGARSRTITAIITMAVLPVASALVGSRDRCDRTCDDRAHCDSRVGV